MCSPSFSDPFDLETIDPIVFKNDSDDWSTAEGEAMVNNLSKPGTRSHSQVLNAALALTKMSENTAKITEAYLIGTEPYGKNRYTTKPLAYRSTSQPPNYYKGALVVDPYNITTRSPTPRVSKNRGTVRTRVAVKSLTLNGNSTRRRTVDAGVYAAKDKGTKGPHYNSAARGIFEAKQITFHGEKGPLKIRIGIDRDYENKENFYIKSTPEATPARPRCATCGKPVKGHKSLRGCFKGIGVHDGTCDGPK